MESVLNKVKLRRGQKVRWLDVQIVESRYIMNSEEGYVIVSLGGRYGTPKKIPINMIISYEK